MVRGKTIQIYLPDGNPKGVKICEIPSLISKAVLIPRNMINEAHGFENLKKVGIYFLFSEKDENNQFNTYVGEAEEILTRLKQHYSNREDWNYAICFFSEKGNLNKAHVKFLESYSYELSKKVGITNLVNNCSPTRSTLTNSEKDFALDFFDEIKLILSTLGYPIFEGIKKAKSKEEIFYCKGKDADAKGNLTEEGFVVYANSKSNLQESPSAGSWLKNRRQKLIDEEILKKDGEILLFSKDFIFNSPSTAAGIILARRANGWKEWKNSNGQTLDEMKRKDIES